MGRRRTLMTNADSYEIFIVGEQLRLQMTSAGQVRDRRYHLRKYKNCIIGRDAVDWLVKHFHVQSRDDAVKGMQILQDYGLLHHVVDEHDFKDDHLFYRFTYDDGSYKVNSKDLPSFFRGVDIYRILKSSPCNVMRDYYHKGILYKEAFFGSDAVDQVTAAEQFPDRNGIIKDFRDLLEKDIIKHVTDDYHFSYDRLIYEFNLDFQKPCLLHDVIDTVARLNKAGRPKNQKSSPGLSRPNQASGTCVDEFEVIDNARPRSSLRSTQTSSRSSVDSGVGSSSYKTTSIASRSMHSCSESSDASGSPPGENAFGLASQNTEPRSVLIRPITLEELEDPQAPVVKRFVQIVRDEIGFGFVVRGASPCYVQTVDPSGPANRAGVRVRQFVSHINGIEVIRMNHREVASLMAQYEVLNVLFLMHRNGDRIS